MLYSLLLLKALYLCFSRRTSLELRYNLVFRIAFSFFRKCALLRVKFYTTFLELGNRAFLISHHWTRRSLVNCTDRSDHRSRRLSTWARCCRKRDSSRSNCLSWCGDTSGSAWSGPRTSERRHTALWTLCICSAHSRPLGFCWQEIIRQERARLNLATHELRSYLLQSGCFFLYRNKLKKSLHPAWSW